MWRQPLFGLVEELKMMDATLWRNKNNYELFMNSKKQYYRLLYNQIKWIHIKGNNRTGWDTFTVWHNVEFIWSLHNLSYSKDRPQ